MMHAVKARDHFARLRFSKNTRLQTLNCGIIRNNVLYSVTHNFLWLINEIDSIVEGHD